MLADAVKIVYEDAEVIVADKPAGLAVETKRVAEEDLESLLRKRYPQDKCLFPITRIDQPVSGLVLFARTKRAAAELSRQLQEHTIQKKYRAFVSGSFESFDSEKDPASETGLAKPAGTKELRDRLIKDAKTNTSRVVKPGEKDYKAAREAILFYTEVAPGELEIDLKTGRHHQIRVQLANAGHPILGDYKYGNEASVAETKEKGITSLMLTAEELTFKHPADGRVICVRAGGA